MKNINRLLFQTAHNKLVFQKIFTDITYSISGEVHSLISYGGGKYKMRKELNDVFNELSQTQKFDTYIDGFFGMGGSLKSLSPSLSKHGVKQVIVNEINPCIITLHENLRNSAPQMKDYFLEYIRNEIILPYKKLYISLDDMKIVKIKMKNRFLELQKKQAFGVETSTLFLMLSVFNFSGVVGFKSDGSISFSNSIYEFKDIKDFFFSILKRIDTFNQLYNQFEMKFYNNSFFTLYHHFHTEPHTLWNIDPVYLEENLTPYDKKTMSSFTNNDIKGCSVNYSQNKFNHLGVLDCLQNINFIYNNNTHPILEHYKQKFNLHSKEFIRNENIPNQMNRRKKVKEIILYGNNFHTKINNITYSQQKNKSA